MLLRELALAVATVAGGGVAAQRVMNVMISESVQNTLIITLGTVLVTFIPAYFGWKTWKASRKAEKAEGVVVEKAAQVKTATEQVDQALTGIELLLPTIHRLQAEAIRREAADREMRILLAAHGQWDILMLAEVRKINPDFPDPPPLVRLDPELAPPDPTEGLHDGLGG